jgi:hypothetical protein
MITYTLYVFLSFSANDPLDVVPGIESLAKCEAIASGRRKVFPKYLYLCKQQRNRGI